MKLAHVSAWLVMLLTAAVTPAYGASLSFVPIGSQLDNDLINDLPKKVGDTVSFDLQLDTTGLTANLQSLEFLLVRNTTELGFIDAIGTPEQISAFPNEEVIIKIDPVLQNIVGINRLSGSGVPANTVIDFATFNYQALPGLTNDGLTDFTIAVTSAIDANGTDVTNLFQPSEQTIDVQPVPEPTSLFGLFGLSALVSIFYRHRGRSYGN
ncbi:PEP-CTERM sorting domain-containing protein [Tolypothrix sp. VBCCA 56010]|uniref:PEP-CTERM sorting domain-containing protein n=1 Tax=Tolypothrix sp. VBCCA 56010 TaxID=3137731 RepID=UPI003D7CE374